MLVIAVTLLVSYVYFYPGEGWNDNSRFDTTRAIVEQHTLRIDAYHENTRDKALWEGHFYSDKAPGLALTAVPVWALGRLALRLARKDPSSPRSILAERYLSTAVTVALPTAIAAICLFIIARRTGASVSGAGFAAVAWGLATPFWSYATVFWEPALSTACLLFAFTFAANLREFHSSRRDVVTGALVGLAAGWATVTDFPAGPAAVILAGLALGNAWPAGRARVFRVAAGVTAGALVCVLVLLIYNTLAFSSPFRLGYFVSAREYFPWSTHGFMGITYPKAYVLSEILVGHYRGLLPLAPLLVAAPFGFLLLWKQAEQRKAAFAAAAIVLYYILFNASIPNWDGGWCYGPRFLASALPFLCLPLGLLWTRSSVVLRSLLSLLALYGISLSLVAVSTTIMPPAVPMRFLVQLPSQRLGDIHARYPMQQLLWPAFQAGELSIAPESWNLGKLAGLPGLASLMPLLFIWAGAAFLWMWLARLRVVHSPIQASSAVMGVEENTKPPTQ